MTAALKWRIGGGANDELSGHKSGFEFSWWPVLPTAEPRRLCWYSSRKRRDAAPVCVNPRSEIWTAYVQAKPPIIPVNWENYRVIVEFLPSYRSLLGLAGSGDGDFRKLLCFYYSLPHPQSSYLVDAFTVLITYLIFFRYDEDTRLSPLNSESRYYLHKINCNSYCVFINMKKIKTVC